MDSKDPVKLVESLGGEFSPSLDAYATGRIGVHQIVCLLCKQAPCVCGPCPNCGWHGAPGSCQAC